MLPAREVTKLRKSLKEHHKFTVNLAVGDQCGKLIVQSSTVWDTDHTPEKPISILIAYEGGGCIVYNGKSPLTLFALMCQGFTLPASQVVTQLLNKIFFQFDNRLLSHATKRKPRKPKVTTDESSSCTNRTPSRSRTSRPPRE